MSPRRASTTAVLPSYLDVVGTLHVGDGSALRVIERDTQLVGDDAEAFGARCREGHGVAVQLRLHIIVEPPCAVLVVPTTLAVLKQLHAALHCDALHKGGRFRSRGAAGGSHVRRARVIRGEVVRYRTGIVRLGVLPAEVALLGEKDALHRAAASSSAQCTSPCCPVIRKPYHKMAKEAIGSQGIYVKSQKPPPPRRKRRGEATFSDAQMKYIRAELYRKRKNAIVLLKCGGDGWECADINELKCLLPFPHHIDGFDPDSGEMLERLLSCGKEKLSELEEYLECVNDGKHPAMMSVLLAHINRLSDGKSAAWLDSEELFTAPDDSQTLKKEWKFKKDNALGGYKIMAYLGKDPCPTMPETIDSVPVVAISSEAFRFLRIPTGMHLPKTLKVIGKHAFAESNITEIVIPDEVTALPALFLGCDRLKRVVLPAKLEKLNPWTFPPHTSSAYSRYDGAAWALEEIDICNDNPHFAACDGVLIDREKGTILHFPAKKTTFTVPACVKKIGSDVFAFTDIKDLKLHAEVLSISEVAFVGCVGLTLHAPAGSYAESYAKEHNIPFVAE